MRTRARFRLGAGLLATLLVTAIRAGEAALPAEAERLLEQAHGPDPAARVQALESLRHVRFSKLPMADRLLDLLKASEPEVRSEAAKTLCKLDLRPVAPTLRKLLEDPSPPTRLWAAYTLSALQEGCARPILEGFLKHEHPHARGIAAEALGRLKDPAAIPALRPLLAEPEPICLVALFALAQLGDPSVMPELSGRLGHAEPAVRMAAAAFLGELGEPSAVPALRKAFQEERSAQVRRHQAMALLRLGERDLAVPTALESLRASEASIRLETLSGLTLSGTRDPAFVPELVRLAKDPEPWIRLAAAAALGAQGSRRNAIPLADLLQDEDPLIRDEAALALMKLVEEAWPSGEAGVDAARRWRVQHLHDPEFGGTPEEERP